MIKYGKSTRIFGEDKYADTLEKFMELDHVIRVETSGMVHDHVPGVHAPDVRVELDADGQIVGTAEQDMIDSIGGGWEPVTGFSGQWQYGGPIMHTSEFIGGGMEEHITSTPGVYVAVSVECDRPADECEGGDGPCPEEYEGECTCMAQDEPPAGWMLLHKATLPTDLES